MRILHVVPSYYPATYWGGPIFSVYALNNALSALPGVELTVLTTDSAGPKVSERLEAKDTNGLYPGQRVVIARRMAGASVSLELLRRLPGLLRCADIVHLTATYSFPVLPTLLFCRLFGKPLVWSPRGAIQDAHEWEGTRRRRLKRVWEKIFNTLVLEGKAVAHVTSERERVATQMRLPHPKAVVIPNGVDVPEELPVRNWLPHGRLRLMYLGRLSPKKGIENLLDAIELLEHQDVVLTISGTGEKTYVERLEERAALLPKGKVVFAGHVDGTAKEAAFVHADLCVVPSHTENFCMVVAEALARGVPVVASTGTPWQAIEDHGCGLWADNNPQNLANAIDKIRKMGLAEMGERGRDWMRREFSWSWVAAEMMRVYCTLVTRNE